MSSVPGITRIPHHRFFPWCGRALRVSGAMASHIARTSMHRTRFHWRSKPGSLVLFAICIAVHERENLRSAAFSLLRCCGVGCFLLRGFVPLGLGEMFLHDSCPTLRENVGQLWLLAPSPSAWSSPTRRRRRRRRGTCRSWTWRWPSPGRCRRCSASTR